MELCTSRALSRLPHHYLFTPSRRNPQVIPIKKTTFSHKIPGLLYFATPLLRATTEETSTSIIKESEEVPDGTINMEGNQVNEQNGPYESMTTEEAPKEEAPIGGQVQAIEFLKNLNIKLDPEDTYSVLLYGSGALVALWLASAVVGAIDSIPLIPQALEIVGLAFTVWFSYRYLIFKKNRDELLAKIEELKQEIL